MHSRFFALYTNLFFSLLQASLELLKNALIHKLFTEGERFWNATVSLMERQIRIIDNNRQQKTA